MEVKSVYMDLVEWVKKGNVWKLESEAFKKPIEIKICYDNQELKQFYTTCEALDKKIADQWEEIKSLQHNSVNALKYSLHTDDRLSDHEEEMEKLKWTIDEQRGEIKSLYKEIADAKTTIEMLSGTILHLQEQVKLLEKKVTKQPTVFHDKCFISWRESSGLRVCELPDGEYLLIMNTKVWEHNEYVENKDDFVVEKIKVSGPYVPFYKLVWGTELDTPTATIYYDLVFIPI